MPRSRKNSKKRPDKSFKKSRPPGKSLKNINAANVGLRRSERRTANAFASSRITTNRLTLPLRFLDKAIKSETITGKKEPPVIISERSKHILNEDLLALIPSAPVRTEGDKCVAPLNRRITRSWNNRFVDASSYYLSCISNQATCSNTLNNQTAPTRSDIFVESNIEVDEPKEVFEEDQVEVVNVTTNLTIFNNTFNEKIRPVNYKFCHTIFDNIKIKLRSAKRDGIFKLKETIEKLNDILEGKRSPSPPKFKMSTKRLSEEDCVPVPLLQPSQWVYSTPDKQNIKHFVFEEPKEKILPAVIRTSTKAKVLYDITNDVMQQLNKFKNGQNIPIDKRYLKTICESVIDNEEIAHPNPSKKQRLDENAEKENIFTFTAPKTSEFNFASVIENAAEEVPSTSNRDEYNVFLSGASEESIDIHEEIQRGTESTMDVSFEERSMEETIRRDLKEIEERCAHFDFRQCRSALPKESVYYIENDPYETAPVDYRHQLLLATQRPAKTARRIQKRHLLKAKSLSFENTPPGAKVAVFEPKRLDMIHKMEDDCLDKFEQEFPSLNTATTSNTATASNTANSSDPIDMPHTITSGALNNTSNIQDYEIGNEFDMKGFNDNVQNMYKFYPRRNFDSNNFLNRRCIRPKCNSWYFF